MPYNIEKYKSGFHAVSPSGHALSKKPMTKEQVKKQIIAVNILESKIDDDLYLKIAKSKARQAGYNPALLILSKDKKHKLEYDGVKFGKQGYKDFIIYSILANKGLITKEEALKHRNAYLSRATKIKGNWRDNKNSPNNLAISIIW